MNQLKYIFFAFLLMPNFIFAQAPTVSLSIDKDSVLIGDVFKVDAKISFAQNGRVLNSGLVDLPKSEEWEIVDRVNLSKNDTLDAAGHLRMFVNEYFSAIVFKDEGWIEIPSVEYTIEYQDTTYQVHSNPAKVYVKPIVKTSDVPADLKTIIKEPLTLNDFLPWILGFIILGMAIALFLYLRQREPERELVPIPKKTKVKPIEKALKALKKLKKEKIWEQDPKLNQVQLSQIVRRYIEEEFKVPALESTTNEIDRSLKKYISTLQRNTLQKLLNDSDMVKFAKLTMPDERQIESIKEAIKWVKNNSFQ